MAVDGGPEFMEHLLCTGLQVFDVVAVAGDDDEIRAVL
jgi:hypothetical protein